MHLSVQHKVMMASFFCITLVVLLYCNLTGPTGILFDNEFTINFKNRGRTLCMPESIVYDFSNQVLAKRTNVSPSEICHLIHTYAFMNNQVEVDRCIIALQNQLGVLCSQTLQPTRFGFEFLDLRHNKYAESHRGQYLEALAFSPSRNVTLLSYRGQQITMDRLIQSYCLSANSQQDLEWLITAFAIRLRPGSSWRDKHGEIVNVDIMANWLLDKKISTLSCYGSHRNIALRMLLFIDSSKQMLSSATRRRIDLHLKQQTKQILESQLADGSCRLPSELNPQQYLERSAILSYTSHSLEFISLASDNSVQENEFLHKSINFIIECYRRDPLLIQTNPCPAYHCHNAISLTFTGPINGRSP